MLDENKKIKCNAGLTVLELLPHSRLLTLVLSCRLYAFYRFKSGKQFFTN